MAVSFAGLVGDSRSPGTNRATHYRDAWYLFSYDISDARRGRKALRCLAPWRVGGQLSVHETHLSPRMVDELLAELLSFLNRRKDRLLVCRSHGRTGPVVQISPISHAVSLLPFSAQRHGPGHLSGDGTFLITYDIRCPKRLRAVQRCVSLASLAMQRSVYLFQGSGHDMTALLDRVSQRMDRSEDDLRVYRLRGMGDIWFPCGPVPPLPGAQEETGTVGWWKWLIGIMRKR